VKLLLVRAQADQKKGKKKVLEKNEVLLDGRREGFFKPQHGQVCDRDRTILEKVERGREENDGAPELVSIRHRAHRVIEKLPDESTNLALEAKKNQR